MKMITALALGLLIAACDETYAQPSDYAADTTTDDGVGGVWHIAN